MSQSDNSPPLQNAPSQQVYNLKFLPYQPSNQRPAKQQKTKRREKDGNDENPPNKVRPRSSMDPPAVPSPQSRMKNYFGKTRTSVSTSQANLDLLGSRRLNSSTSSLDDALHLSGAIPRTNFTTQFACNQIQESVSDSEISLTLIDTEAAHRNPADELSARFEHCFSSNQGMSNNETISMSDVLELDMFNNTDSVYVQTSQGQDINFSALDIKSSPPGSRQSWGTVQPSSRPDSAQGSSPVVVNTHIQPKSNQKFTIHNPDSGQRTQTKLVEEAYDDTGTLAEIIENGQIQPLEFILVQNTSPLQKVNEESLTYLNQGQAYGVRLKRRPEACKQMGLQMDTPFRICLRVIFHDRRLQNTEAEQIESWSQANPGKRFIEIDKELSTEISCVSNKKEELNCSELVWASSKDAVVFIKINCISTEFTQKKHGGEKGAPFRLQLDAFKEDPSVMQFNSSQCIQASSCQIRVFKPRGADRKQKSDHQRVSKEMADESCKGKYIPCYERTRLQPTQPWEPRLPLTPSLKSSPSQNLGFRETQSDDTMILDQNQSVDQSVFAGVGNITHSSSVGFVQAWLKRRNFHAFTQKFANFSGSDLLSLSREDMLQIGLAPPQIHVAEVIRLHNAIMNPANGPEKSVTCFYIRTVDEDLHYPVFLKAPTVQNLTECLAMVTQVDPAQINRVINRRKSASQSNNDIKVIVTDEMVATFQNETSFTVLLVGSPEEGLTAVIHR
ncbi:Oidioi.mRNA.OKI2018_I69.XSR.g16930.t1.cds [Oikopleura dioica]|uniref:Oidioi.mRNA.OKI2018_I69.XSR.g16930.t1.cds n=1 Tax=Oikopleura dioica TaxID=34765 RepID=A0ABN7SI56_OIKDI|nr:Oidioi.mRNA.OKI2018_I69.XSR.g16930.t1.cds [Oikopleura dioica]